MKKPLIITLIVILLLVMIGGAVLFFNLTKEKPSITAVNFADIMEAKDFMIIDIVSQYSDNPNLKQAYLAVSNDYFYQIEFHEFNEDKDAIDFFNASKESFEGLTGNTSTQTNISISNYSKYTLTSDGLYMLVSRINNTVIYVNANDDCKDSINTLLEELGY